MECVISHKHHMASEKNTKVIPCSIIEAPDIITKGCLSPNGFFYIEIKQGENIIKLPANEHVSLMVALLETREDMGLGGDSLQFAPI